MGRFKPNASQLLGLVFSGLLLVAVACGPAAAPTPTVGTPGVHPGKVTILVGDFSAERFDRVFQVGGDPYARLIHGFLISSDVREGRKIISPGIASKWGLSKDGLTWSFTIRKGVKFHDGTDLTVEDVLWTLRHVMGPQAVEYSKSTAPLALAKEVQRIEQTGPDEVSVTMKSFLGTLALDLSEASQSWMGAVYPKRATLHDVKDEEAYDRNPIGAGVMRMVKRVPATSMTFERFAGYYYQPENGFPLDKRVNFTQLELGMVAEEATRVAALRAGEADIAPISLVTRKQVEAGGGRVVFGAEAAYLQAVQYGCYRPQFPCHDKRVRQALAYAVNTELIRDKLYGPEVMQVVGWTVVTPSTIGYSPELKPFPFDPAKARQLLADAGYPGGKGFGTLTVNAYEDPLVPFAPEVALTLADSWRKELGLDVAVKVGEATAVRTTEKTTEELFGQVLVSSNDTRPDGLTMAWRKYGGGWSDLPNRSSEDPELNTLVNKTRNIMDPVQSEKALTSMYLRLRDEAYDVMIGATNIAWGAGPRILTWQPEPLSVYPSGLHTMTLK